MTLTKTLLLFITNPFLHLQIGLKRPFHKVISYYNKKNTSSLYQRANLLQARHATPSLKYMRARARGREREERERERESRLTL